MFPSIRRSLDLFGCLVVFGVIAHGARAAEPKPLEFHVAFDPKVSNVPFTGRVYVMLSREPVTEPRSGPNWFRPEPFFARDVKDWKPGEGAILGADVLGCPTPLPKLPKGMYHAQAVMDFDTVLPRLRAPLPRGDRVVPVRVLRELILRM